LLLKHTVFAPSGTGNAIKRRDSGAVFRAPVGISQGMSDLEPESFAEFVTTDGPGSADVSQLPPATGEDGTQPEPVDDIIQRGVEEQDDQVL
jgi:hypothetical protein